MRLIFAILLLGSVAISCTKNKFTTKPQLKVTKVSHTEISGTETLRFTIHITDKEGDFTSLIGYRKKVPGCVNSNFLDSTKLHIPSDFIATRDKEGDIVIDMDKTIRGDNQCTGTGGTFKVDTATFCFWTKDAAGNISDTACSSPIIIHH
jgi:hypothetical protein